MPQGISFLSTGFLLSQYEGSSTFHMRTDEEVKVLHGLGSLESRNAIPYLQGVLETWPGSAWYPAPLATVAVAGMSIGPSWTNQSVGLAKSPFSFLHKIKDAIFIFTDNFIDLGILSMSAIS